MKRDMMLALTMVLASVALLLPLAGAGLISLFVTGGRSIDLVVGALVLPLLIALLVMIRRFIPK